jgi:hypothetical protein
MTESDFYFRNEGSILMILPVSQDAKTWTTDHVHLEDWQNPNHFAVEPRYFDDLAEGITSDGLTLTEI